jgi:hypothetical protein
VAYDDSVMSLRLALAVVLLASCHNPRPLVCQRFKQCCSAAKASNGETENIRTTCMRKDDSEEATCRQNLELIRSELPSLQDSDECKIP